MVQVHLDDVLIINIEGVLRRWVETEKVLISLNENIAEVN